MKFLLSCVSHQEIEKFELAMDADVIPSLDLEIYPDNGKSSEIDKRSGLPQRSMKSFYCLQPTRGMCLHTAKSTRRFGEIARLVVKTTPLAFTSATYGRSYTRRLPMLPLPSDPSGKSDIALKYKQRNKSQQSDPSGCCSFFNFSD
mgnify:CR=1 FL=1